MLMAGVRSWFRQPEALPITLFAVLAVLVVPIFPHAVSPNEYSRWAMDVALVDFHTLEVTPVLRATGIPIADLAEKDGRLYSNKAPGGSLVVLPAYVAARAIFGPPSIETMRATLNVMRIAGSTIPTILLAMWLAAVARRLGCTESRVRLAVTTLLFATPILTYGLLFFSHALSSLTIFGAWALLFVWRRTPWADVGAGALIGLAVLSEAAGAIPCAVLVACAIPRIRAAGLLRVLAGGLPFAIIFGVYNHLAFGSAFTLSNMYDADAHIRVVNREGLFGLRAPSLPFLIDILLDSSKGLLVLSPVLLMAVAGIGRARRALPRSAFVALLIVPLTIVLVIAGYPYWYGGWGVGARYVVPIIPFLVLLMALAVDTIIEAILFGASAATVAILSLVFPLVPTIFAVPWVSFSWPLLRAGCVVPNVFHFVSRPLAIAIPFALVVAALVVAVPRRRLLFLAAGAALWFAIGFLSEARQPSPPYLRILIEEVHFEHHGVITRSLPPGHPAIQRLESIAAVQKKMPPPSWP